MATPPHQGEVILKTAVHVDAIKPIVYAPVQVPSYFIDIPYFLDILDIQVYILDIFISLIWFAR